jgi:hypothetical protein
LGILLVEKSLRATPYELAECSLANAELYVAQTCKSNPQFSSRDVRYEIDRTGVLFYMILRRKGSDARPGYSESRENNVEF